METQPAHQDAWSKHCSPPAQASTSCSGKAVLAPECKYKCQFCNQTFSRSEHRSRHERSRMCQLSPFPVSSSIQDSPSMACSPHSPSITSGSALQSHSNQLPPIGSQSRKGLVPVLQSTVNSLPNSHLYYCPNCWSPFEDEHSWTSHCLHPNCQPRPTTKELSPEEVKKIKSLRGSDRCSYWLAIWNQFFPEVQSPLSPYVEPNQIEEVKDSKVPQVSSDDELNAVLDHIRSADSEHAIPEGFHLPDLSTYNPSTTSRASFGNVNVKSEDTKKSPSLASIADEEWTKETADFKAVTEASDPCSGGSSIKPSSAHSSGQLGTTQNEPPNPDGCIKSWICNTHSPVLTGDIDMEESRATDSDSEEDSIDLCSDSFAWTECSEPTPEWDPFGEVLAALKREYIGTLLSSFLLLQRQCPVDTASDERNSSSSNGSANRKHRDTPSPPSTDTGSRPAKRRNINGVEDNSDEDEEGNHQQKVPSSITEENLDNGLIFACPFVKRFPDRYRQCYSHTLRDISRVKLHLYRGKYHHLPLYCPRCSETFEDEKLRDEHIRTANCPKKPPRRWDGITQSQSRQLRRRTSSKKTVEENWYDIYKIIFPGEPLPSSPYIDVSLSGELSAFREHELTQGPSIWREILRTRLPSDLKQHSEKFQSFCTSVYPEAISLLYQGWASRNQKPISLPSQSSAQETSIPARSNDILAGGVLDSPPRSDSAIGNSVFGSSENERRPEQHQLEQQGHEQEQTTAQAESQPMVQPSPMYQIMPPYPTPAQFPPQILQSQAFSNPMVQANLADTSQQPIQTSQMGQLVPLTDSDDLLHPMFTSTDGYVGPAGPVASQFHYQPYGDSFGYTQYP